VAVVVVAPVAFVVAFMAAEERKQDDGKHGFLLGCSAVGRGGLTTPVKIAYVNLQSSLF
jgi:hypothetical protein